MMNTCQQRLSAIQKSEESLAQSTRDLGNFLTNVIDQEGNQRDKLKEQVSSCTKNIDDKVKIYEQASTSHCNVIEDFNMELESLSVKRDAHRKMISLILEELDHLSKEEENIKVPDNEIMESKVNRLKVEDAMFRQQLGVEINKIKGGYLQIVFNHISFSKPDSLYMFSLKLGDDRRYIVSDCKPPIADMEEIVRILNSDNDFSKFMHTMRRRFKDEAHKET